MSAYENLNLYQSFLLDTIKVNSIDGVCLLTNSELAEVTDKKNPHYLSKIVKELQLAGYVKLLYESRMRKIIVK